MGDTTRIAWTDVTWNPVTGCTRVSPGCERCYIDWAPPFRIEGRHFRDRDGNRSNAIGSTTGVRLHEDRLTWPLRKRSWRGKRVFVCSLADLFHDAVPDAHIVHVWAVMAATHEWRREITFQVLTKRPARMRGLLSSDEFRAAVTAAAAGLMDEDHADAVYDGIYHHHWPLPNVHVGVTIEDQERANLRIPILLDTPTAVRWLSVEPMLGPVDLREWIVAAGHGENTYPLPYFDWVVVGGESGPGARAMREEWARSVVGQCRAANVPVFVKQMGTVWARENGVRGKADRIEDLPSDMRIRRFPENPHA